MIKVLLADNDAFSRSMYARRFECLHFEVLTADSGDACIRKIRSHNPNVILMELALPKIDGFQVLEFLRRRNDEPDIPVVLLTSLTEQCDVDRCVSFGCRAFFIKPHAKPECVVDAVKASIGEVSYVNV